MFRRCPPGCARASGLLLTPPRAMRCEPALCGSMIASSRQTGGSLALACSRALQVTEMRGLLHSGSARLASEIAGGITKARAWEDVLRDVLRGRRRQPKHVGGVYAPPGHHSSGRPGSAAWWEMGSESRVSSAPMPVSAA